MSNLLKFTYESTRRVLCCGSRAVLYFTTRLPVGESAMIRHLQELAQAFFTYASECVFPEVSRTWETLALAGKGYDFSPRFLAFNASCTPCGRGLRVRLHLSQKGGGMPPLLQECDTFWSADGSYCSKRPIR